MANGTFESIAEVVRNRRTTKPDKMNGRAIPPGEIGQILELANWAPTHGMTEPWQFFIYNGEAARNFCSAHATMYREHTDPASFLQANFDKLLHMADRASHIIVAVMKRGHLPKIAAWEEFAAASCAVQNILLGATALDIASYWGSGGMATHPAMKEFLSLAPEDQVIGILYLGYTDIPLKGKRNSGIEAKLRFH